jgi:hypothetical protein
MDSVCYLVCNAGTGERRTFPSFAEAGFSVRCLGPAAWIGRLDGWTMSRRIGSVRLVVDRGVGPQEMRHREPERPRSVAERAERGARDDALVAAMR